MTDSRETIEGKQRNNSDEGLSGFLFLGWHKMKKIIFSLSLFLFACSCTAHSFYDVGWYYGLTKYGVHGAVDEIESARREAELQEELDKLKSTNKCKKCDLSQAELRGADLNFVNLSDANLSDATLRGADLRHADLSGADLRHADLSGADLMKADLRVANLRGTNLRGANLSDANLSGADLNFTNLRGAGLMRSDLNGANLSDAKLDGAKLCHTTMPDGKENNSGCKK